MRWRAAVFVMGAALLAISYSGRWRVGRDSALYRAVAHSLATGEGYRFRGEPETLIHPGYPLLLAGLERRFGAGDPMRPRGPLLVMTAMAACTLLVIHGLVRARHPPRLAALVTGLCALNPTFLLAATELRPDLPFLCATCLVLYAVEIAPGAMGARRIAVAAAVLVLGLLAAWSMRPTFWFLAAALAFEGALMIRTAADRRAGMSVVLAVAAIVAVALIVHAGAGYRDVALAKLSDPSSLRWHHQLGALLEDRLPRAVLGFGGPPVLAAIVSMLLIAAALSSGTRLWTFYAGITLAGTVLLGANPRYYLAILPFILAGGIRLAERGGTRILAVVLVLVAVPNAIATTRLVLEQRGAAPVDEEFAPFVAMAPVLARHTAPTDKILAAEPRILTFLADRRVHGALELGEGGEPPAGALGRLGFTHVVLCADPGCDRSLRRLVDDSGLAATPIAATAGLELYRLSR